MTDILTSLEKFFIDSSNTSIVIAYSGGVDSQVLLHGLAQLKKQQRLTQKLRVCHVNHGLSANAEYWVKFAEQQCLLVELPLIVCKINIEIKPQQSLEALARDARYQALTSIAEEGESIVTGHHSDDQVETFLLALKRGSGIKGLSAMKTVMPIGQQLLVRPLLQHSRAEIEQYAKQYQLEWIEDESNTDVSFDRNFIRHQVVPVLKGRWPSINQTILRSTQHCNEAQELIDELAQQDLGNCQLVSSMREVGILCCSVLSKLSVARFNNVLRYFLAQHQILMPSTQQLKEIRQQLSAEQDKAPVIQLANHCLRRYQGKLYLTNIYADITQWQSGVELFKTNKQAIDILLPDGLGLLKLSVEECKASEYNNVPPWQMAVRAPRREQTISIRFSHKNPKCLPQYRQKSRELKKVLQELSIPSWQRKRLPFLYYDEELVAVIGHFVCKPYLAGDEAQQLHISL